MNVPTGYDSITLTQWLWFKYRCYDGSGLEFQRLFEEIMKRYNPEFMQIRPYGNIGDRKTDGLLRAESAVFQVYSPDKLTQAKLIKKINNDLDGVVKEWGDDLNSWTFVYNVRHGLPPDIPKILNAKQKQYPHLTLDHLSNDGLWEILRGLTVQQRAEILGAPLGYEKLFIHSENESSLNSIQENKDAWIVLIQDILNPIDISAIVEALKPSSIFGAPVYLHPDTQSWNEAAEYQKSIVHELFEKCRSSFPPRFAVFSLAPVPLIVQLGFLLTNNVPTRYFKMHLDTQSWLWPDESIEAKFNVTGIPTAIIDTECDVVIRVSLSSKVGQHETDETISNTPVQIDIFADNPDLTWLKSLNQVTEFAKVFRGVLGQIREKVLHCKNIHLFMAAAAPIALIAGQQINPRMTPPVQVYEYNRNKKPRYQFAFTLE